jgi:D-glycero-alpha-D-manno-heptose-7-phosphate kinase
MLVYSGKGRSANSILQKQSAAMKDLDKFNLVKRSRDKAFNGLKYLRDNDVDSFGDLLHDAWMDKKGVVNEISQDYFDVVYDKIRNAGAVGGKLLGAGGGGFFVFYVQPDKREEVTRVIENDTQCKIYDFKFTDRGSQIVSIC